MDRITIQTREGIFEYELEKVYADLNMSKKSVTFSFKVYKDKENTKQALAMDIKEKDFDILMTAIKDIVKAHLISEITAQPYVPVNNEKELQRQLLIQKEEELKELNRQYNDDVNRLKSEISKISTTI